MGNGKSSAKKLKLRRRALAVAVALVASGATVACSEDSDSSNERKIETAVSETLNKLLTFGPTLSSVVEDTEGFDLESITTNPIKLGIIGPETEEEYPKYDGSMGGRLLIKTSYVDGQLRIKDHSRDGVDPVLMTWIAKRINERSQVFETAMKNNSLKAINFILDRDDYSFMDGEVYERDEYFVRGSFDIKGSNEIDIVFPHGETTLDRTVFTQLLVHETGHALIERISDEIVSGATPITPEIQRVINACEAVHARAMEQIQTIGIDVYRKLDEAANAEQDPVKRAGLQKLRDVYLSDDVTIAQLQPKFEENWKAAEFTQFGEYGKNCATNNLYRQAGIINEKFFPGLNATPIGDSPSKSAELLDEAEVAFADLMETLTIYGNLTERNINSKSKSGHPEADLGEAIASPFALSVVTPDSLGRKLSWAESPDKELATELIDSANALIVATYPELGELISACEQSRDAAFNDPRATSLPKNKCDLSY